MLNLNHISFFVVLVYCKKLVVEQFNQTGYIHHVFEDSGKSCLTSLSQYCGSNPVNGLCFWIHAFSSLNTNDIDQTEVCKSVQLGVMIVISQADVIVWALLQPQLLFTNNCFQKCILDEQITTWMSQFYTFPQSWPISVFLSCVNSAWSSKTQCFSQCKGNNT